MPDLELSRRVPDLSSGTIDDRTDSPSALMRLQPSRSSAYVTSYEWSIAISTVTLILPDSSRLEPVLPPKYEGHRVWHYTGTPGLLGILTDNGIRASSVWSLNDSGEFSHGINLVKERWESERLRFKHHNEVTPLLTLAEARLRLEDAFVACSSKDGDSLSQWRSYGSYAIGIDSGMRLQVRMAATSGPAVAKWTEAGGEAQKAVETGWREVLYDEASKLEHIEKLFVELDRLAPLYTGNGTEESHNSFRLAIELYACTIAFLKHSAFRDEQEVRLLVRYYSEAPGIQLRSGRFGIVPYVLVESAQDLLTEDVPNFGGDPKRFALREIKIGPGLDDPRAAEAGLQVALKRQQFDVPVKVVDIPFR